MYRCSSRHMERLIAVLGAAYLLGESHTQVASAATFTPEVSRLLEQAEKLERAAGGCRDRVRSGQISDCKVEGNFQHDRLVSPATADALGGPVRGPRPPPCSSQDKQEKK